MNYQENEILSWRAGNVKLYATYQGKWGLEVGIACGNETNEVGRESGYWLVMSWKNLIPSSWYDRPILKFLIEEMK